MVNEENTLALNSEDPDKEQFSLNILELETHSNVSTSSLGEEDDQAIRETVDLPDIDFENISIVAGDTRKDEIVRETFRLNDIPDIDDNFPNRGQTSRQEGDLLQSDDERSSDPKPRRRGKMRVKEVKYGMTVIANIGNFENIRTHIEATAEVESEGDQDFTDCIHELSDHIRKIGRDEYRLIKGKQLRKKNTTISQPSKIQDPTPVESVSSLEGVQSKMDKLENNIPEIIS